ncbi:MAG: NAD(+) diphosphatase [Micrococcales bacterium]|nr:MAG: NAD(+) diphosphatase [Micrococcales bacterium]
MAATAVAMWNWHAQHRFCPRCGAATEPAEAGWLRRCQADGSEQYPRTDPAVIMAVVDDAHRILLAHNPAWPPGRFSTLAGFVEPGESLEDTVRRETLEETGVRVGPVTYLGSQPWPFPASLMIGCLGRAVSTSIQVDPAEIDDARWFTQDEFTAAMRRGDLRFPPTASISRRLIEHWYGTPLPDTQWV